MMHSRGYYCYCFQFLQQIQGLQEEGQKETEQPNMVCAFFWQISPEYTLLLNFDYSEEYRFYSYL